MALRKERDGRTLSTRTATGHRMDWRPEERATLCDTPSSPLSDMGQKDCIFDTCFTADFKLEDKIIFS
jgi:hypothetical protein